MRRTRSSRCPTPSRAPAAPLTLPQPLVLVLALALILTRTLPLPLTSLLLALRHLLCRLRLDHATKARGCRWVVDADGSRAYQQPTPQPTQPQHRAAAPLATHAASHERTAAAAPRLAA